MSSTTIGLVHPGEMGAALGAALRAVGHDVTWASAGRSDATSERAREADLPGDASALKMVYAGWTKGTAALLLALRAVARADRVEDALLREWNESLPDLAARLASAEQSAAKKGWRWVGEMEEIAATFEAAGQPPGFHRAAAEVFREFP